ncbi:MAG: cobalamin biosynthesis protein [Thermoproteota archaeon]|nr:cobalamin biosynthesis protein [Thermoproteota archaeon]
MLCSLSGGVALSFILSDPPNNFHPVSWLGKFIDTIIHKLKNKSENWKLEKLDGVILTLFLAAGACITNQLLSLYIYSTLGLIGFTIYAVIVLKSSIAILTMEKHVYAIIMALEKNDLERARKSLSYIVSRNTSTLDIQHVLSGTIESIGESVVDGIIAPLFYYSFFGPSGAVGYRVVNTLDSMIGYKDKYHFNIGWMSAKADTILNYVPARLCAVLMIFSARIVGADWKNSIHVLSTDHRNTSSVNAGYPMSTMAGALRIKLEKIDEYTLGTELEPLSIEKCSTAIKIMKVTTIIFCALVSFPLIILLSTIGWWNFFFGF